MDSDAGRQAAGDSAARRVVIVGAGRVGRAVARALSRDNRYRVLIGDIDAQALKLVPSGIDTSEIGFGLRTWLDRNLPGAAAIVCATPASAAPEIARSAHAAGCHYLDTIEDARIAREVAGIASGATRAFVTGCGLAPGLVEALLRAVISPAAPDSDLTVMVGVLPCKPSGRLGLANFWGVDGLVAEYTGTCPAIRNGKATILAPLTELEQITIGEQKLEAFTTSGTLDPVIPDAEGKVRSLTFKTLRTRGHLDYIRFLLEDMGLAGRLYQFRSLLQNVLPVGTCDRIIVHFVRRDGAGTSPSHWTWTHSAADSEPGQLAIGTVTAAHLASVLDHVLAGAAGLRGHIHAASIAPDKLAKSPFYRGLPTDVRFGQEIQT